MVLRSSGYLARSVLMPSVRSPMSKLVAHDSNSAPDGSFVKRSGDVCITCSCASNREVWMTRLPCASLLSKSTVPPWAVSSGGAMLMASRRKFRTLPPNRRRASSAASSARWRSLRRLAASTRRRARTDSGCCAASSDGRALDLVGVDWLSSSGAWIVFCVKDRVRLMIDSRRSVRPFVASSPTSASSFWA